MTTTARNARAAELDAIIARLHDELDACSARLWASDRNQYRLDLLIEYTTKRNAL